MRKNDLRQYFKSMRESYIKKHPDTDFEAQFLTTFLNYVTDQHLDLSRCITALYYPFGAEASPIKILEYLLTNGYPVALPKMQGETITFAPYSRDVSLLKNNFGFYEPDSHKSTHPDIIIMPLLCFDSTGHRLGYGKGHYDKTIDLISPSKCPHLIGLAYSCQEINILPFEPHDKKLNVILLPNKYKIF
ncbi:MAG: 5-formyltetrahydrofolate cyclo-ligase [Alphaproteobacteria bacterium]|nr:5-formyltetrahydrofolate cyclo-ligase [Alphaproteobacteria bacterium]